jgi:hypothetical protein
VDACFAGRFILDLPLSDHPNLAIVETAARADETSLFFLGPELKFRSGKTLKNPTHNPGVAGGENTGRSEFTNGLLAGMETFATSADAVAKAQAAGGSFLGQMLKQSFTLGANEDWGQQLGWMTPLEQDRLPTAPPPPPPPPTSFNVTVQGWYQHFSGYSHDCFGIITFPPQPSAMFMSHLDGGTVTGSRDMTGFLGPDGRATVTYPISAYGLYNEQVTVTSGMQTRTGSTTLNVTASPGTTPCP